MGVVKITFDGSSVSSKQDAVLNYFLCGGIQEGILKGIESEISCSVSNNYITFNSGYAQIYGRRIYVESNTQIYVALDSTKNGYVVLDINLSQNTAILNKIEVSSGWPSLVKENLLTDGNRYQMVLCKYSKTVSSITLQTYSKTMIPTPLSQAQSGYNNAVSYINDNYCIECKRYPTSTSGNTYKFDMTGINLSKTLVIVSLSDNVFIPYPAGFFSNHSISAQYYRWINTDYTLIQEWLPYNIVSLNTGTSYVSIKALYIYKFGN